MVHTRHCRTIISSVFFTLWPALAATAQVPPLDWPLETVSGGHGFTEGAAVAPDGRVYFSDMDNRRIMVYDPSTGGTRTWQPASGKSNGLYISEDTLYACEAAGRAVSRYVLSKGPGSREVLTATYMGDSLGCPNDLTLAGGTLYFSEFWIGGFHEKSGAEREIFRNRVYSLEPGQTEPDSVAFRFDTPNGVASSPDGRYLFVGDIRASKLYRADLTSGEPSAWELLADVGAMGLEGPDGMAIARDGRIFLALYGSDRLLVLDGNGHPLGTLNTGPLTSNCIFAADGKTLYITADKSLKRVAVKQPQGSIQEAELP